MRSVLMFHGIGNPRAGLPADELPYWVSASKFKELVKVFTEESKHEIVWTFDDGNSSDLLAAQELATGGLTGKFFVLSGRIGRTGYLSKSDLRELDSLGMEIGTHGQDHIDWRKADDQVLREEVRGSAQVISDIIGRRIHSLAIPFGYYDRRVFTYLAESDITTIYTSDTGLSRSTDRFVRRNPVKTYHTTADVLRIAADQVPLLQRLRRTVAPVLKRSIL